MRMKFRRNVWDISKSQINVVALGQLNWNIKEWSVLKKHGETKSSSTSCDNQKLSEQFVEAA